MIYMIIYEIASSLDPPNSVAESGLAMTNTTQRDGHLVILDIFNRRNDRYYKSGLQ